MVPRFANVPSVDSCHGEIEEAEGETDRNVTIVVDFSIFLCSFNRDIVSKWLLREYGHSLLIYSFTYILSYQDLANLGLTKPQQPIGQIM